MVKKVFQFFCLFVFLFFLFYLLLPGPAEPPPLPDSVMSKAPGDTGQIPGLFAYYTNQSREQVTAFYRYYFSRSSWRIPLLTYRLNHPPEYTWVVIRDTEHSSFLEEFVHPFRESVYINGYEPAKDPFVKNGQKMGNFEIDGKIYSMKVQVLRKDSQPIIRIIIFLTCALSLVWLLSLAKETYESIRNHR